MEKSNKIVVKEEEDKTIIEIDANLEANIYWLVKDWPDIISNEENMKILCELNITSPQRIQELTDAICQISKALNREKDTVIRVVDKQN